MKMVYSIEPLSEVDVRSDEVPLFSVRVRDVERRYGGFLNVVEQSVSSRSFECRRDLYEVLDELTWRPSLSYVGRAQRSYLHPTLRQRGIGIGLYVAAAIECKRLGMALVADVCGGGETSREAERVYRSRTLRDYAVVSGWVMVAR